MRIRDVFLSAIVRKLAYVLVVLVLAWCGIGKAHAATYPDRGSAYAGCMAAAAHVNSFDDPGSTEYGGAICQHQAVSFRYVCFAGANGGPPNDLCNNIPGGGGADPFHLYPSAQECPTGTVWSELAKDCKTAGCLNQPSSAVFPEMQGTGMCAMSDVGGGGQAGCEFSAVYVPQGAGSEFPGALEGYVNMVPTGDLCDPENFECGEDETPGQYQGAPTCTPKETCPGNGTPNEAGQCPPPVECPQGQHKEQNGHCYPNSDTCPYGQVKAPDGSCIKDTTNNCPTGQAKGSDGTCKPDANGDGVPDGESDSGTFAGGEDCNAPPACSGDNIMCGQARIQWRIDCNTRKNVEISGGTCDAMPICTGDGCDLRQHKQLIMQWRVACATEKLLDKTAATGSGTCTPDNTPGDQNCNGQPDWTENPGDGTNQNLGDPGSPDGAVVEGDAIGADGLDVAGLGFSETCPTPPTIQLMDRTITLDTSVFCNWLILGGQFVLIAAALLSLRILGGGSSV